jgi:hypothetical protein
MGQQRKRPSSQISCASRKKLVLLDFVVKPDNSQPPQNFVTTKEMAEPTSDRSGSEESPPQFAVRDEVKEIEKQNKTATGRVRTWRLIVTCILAATGIAVATSSYLALLKQEEQNFADAVSIPP